ncbi:ribosomal L7Ae/L30e/S12e/Gadd45 family protein [Apilactobacillus kunkeei]|uniref:L7Ae/L30e/S12e/Gadd45 family ribosomal protein n=1 Tax=Apilactobacillus kunkeei TaxID=148814 RepID=UPI00200A7095|nr:ribosomal L7Ae/L30e/S12e/Gadd45 family protein [Apilactobacillus kunkeei]MCK8633631.1 ribosomal L7Ae/L30e/S12e/Gadd45 family protein [Apilactobacillus kunkeei]
MTNKEQILNFIGLAKRAGKITTGENILLNAIKKNKIKFLIIATDSGKASLKKFTDKANSYNIPTNQMFTKVEISDAIGMPRTIIGIADNGFAKRLKEMTN